MARNLYKALDYCLEHHWPSNEDLRKLFDKDFLRRHGIFVGDRYSALNTEKSLVLGDACITYRYNGFSVGHVYARDTSKIRVYARNRSMVVVHLFDKAQVHAEQFDGARLTILCYSPDTWVEAEGNVKVKRDCVFS